MQFQISYIILPITNWQRIYHVGNSVYQMTWVENRYVFISRQKLHSFRIKCLAVSSIRSEICICVAIDIQIRLWIIYHHLLVEAVECLPKVRLADVAFARVVEIAELITCPRKSAYPYSCPSKIVCTNISLFFWFFWFPHKIGTLVSTL